MSNITSPSQTWGAWNDGLSSPRGIGSKSVLHTLLNREMGFSNWIGTGHGNCSESFFTRQILNSRTSSVKKLGKSVKPVKTVLNRQNGNGNNLNYDDFWVQVALTDKTEVGITDGLFWTRKKLGTGFGTMAKEEFYNVQPSSTAGLKFLKSHHSHASGKISKAFVVGSSRTLKYGKATTYFFTLVEPGIIRAFDLVRNVVEDEVNLPLNISEEVTGYKEMDVFENSRKIFVMGSGKSLTKVIVVINYPPWKEMGIIHVEFPVQITMSDGVCFLVQGKLLQITTWPLLMQKVTKDSSRASQNASNHTRVPIPVVKFEGKLSDLPIILNKVNINSMYFGLFRSLRVPVYYTSAKTGLNFYTFDGKSDPVYKFLNNSFYDADEPMEVFELASKALICTHFSGQSELIEFKSEWNDETNENILIATPLNSTLKFWDSIRIQDNTSAVGNRVEMRPKRSCVNSIVTSQFSSKITILGMALCTLMDLVAVLTANEEDFQVVIYEPLKLLPLKALPPVHVWSRVKGTDDPNKRRESINIVDFIFEPEFIFINFIYSTECKPQRDVFFARLLSERF